MNPNYLSIFLFFLPCLFFNLSAQDLNCEATSLDAFYECYGGRNQFSQHSITATTTFIQAEEALKSGDYSEAKRLVSSIFNTYPKGDPVWWNVNNAPNGSNLGTPHAYYGLRMIEDIADFQLNNSVVQEVKQANMKIVLVGCSEGRQPSTQAELLSGSGAIVNNAIDPALAEDDYRIVRQSFEFFSTYVTAITDGRLEINIEIVELPDLCMPVSVSSRKPYVASGSIAPVWENLSEEVKQNTDWWWILYPSHVPDAPVFDDEAFITGGMGLDEKGGPAFIIDDLWIVRKPPHLGAGKYSDIERRIYLPQWFQHEFYHHLYRAYPELKLEVNGHDWFNRNFWPADFEGTFEPDYYAETLHKRLQVDCVPLETKLITRVEEAQQRQFENLSIEELLGPYSLDNIQNPWHEGEIIKQGSQYYWKNKANVQWQVLPDIKSGKLLTTTDSPYPGQDFFLELYRSIDGSYSPGVLALKYQGELYKKRFNLLRGQFPIEIALGSYQRFPTKLPLHSGLIRKEEGRFIWENEQASQWPLLPDTDAELFKLTADSPTPTEVFDLILVEDECGIHPLGFAYAGDYYWRPKRSLENESPFVKDSIENISMLTTFNNYSIDLSEVFEDPEGDQLYYFTASEHPNLIETRIENQALILSADQLGNGTIYVYALDGNGGLAIEEIVVNIGEVVSTQNLAASSLGLSIFPNPTQNDLTIVGPIKDYRILIQSIDKSMQKEFIAKEDRLQIQLNGLPPGIYLLSVIDENAGKRWLEKIILFD